MDRVERYRWTSAMLDVPFLLGALGASALAGPSLVTLLAGLQRDESAARNLLTRMRAMGVLDVEPRGRVNVYRLASGSSERYREVEGTQQQAAWTGTFEAVLYHVPEKQRSLRDRLLHNGRSAGYGLLRAGVLIAATPRWQRLRLPLEEFVGDCWLHRASITPYDPDDARTMAARAWDLPELTRLYERALAQCSATPPVVEVSWASLRQWRELYAVFFEAQLRDPNLPVELLPDDWPQRRFAAAQSAVNVSFGREVLPFLREQADARDTYGLNVYYDPPWI